MFGLALCIAFLTAAPSASANDAPTPAPPQRQSLDDAWWTGPMMAAGAATLPRGHLLVEPYVYDVVTYAHYDDKGARSAAKREASFGSLTYMLYGLTDRLSVGLLPAFGRGGVGDWTALAQYQLVHERPHSWLPTTSFIVQETFPTGRYDRLGTHPQNGLGSGAYTTTLALYTQKYFWLRNGRILRARVDILDSFSSSAAVNDVSVYGTDTGFHGSAKPGNSFILDVAQEYSITRRWVFAIDETYRHQASTRISGGDTAFGTGSSDALILAPAIEYNSSPNLGVLFGLRITPAGRNAPAMLAPTIAINMVH